jgi:glycosyltransferase involved in cell wall biosynthesis
MDEAAVPSHVSEHRRLREATRYTATVVCSILEQWFSFDSVLDLGCGTGNWLSCFAAMGRRTVLGLEMEQFAENEHEIDPRLILRVDLGQYLNLQRRFDLALCLEVAEHIDHQFAPMVVDNCTRHSDIVLFSAALPGQQGLHHVNEQRPDYWAALFEEHNYAVLDGIRPLIWNDPQVPVWYRQNILLFIRRTSPDFTTIEARSKTSAARMPLALAHPEYLAYFSGLALKSQEIEVSLSARIGSLSAEIRQLTVKLIELRSQASNDQAPVVESPPDVQVYTTGIVRSIVWGSYRSLRPIARCLPLPVRHALRESLRRMSRVLPLPIAPSPPGILVPNRSVPKASSQDGRARPSETRGNTVVFVSGEARTPGHVYRVLRLANAAAAIGADSHWLALEDYESHRAILRRANVVILWRAANSPATSAVIRIAREASAKLLFDVDDLIFLPEIAKVEIIDGIRSQNFSAAETARLFLRFREVMDQADACLCTTRELADQIRQLSMLAYIVPNGFDYQSFGVGRCASRRWRTMREDSLIRIGYASGSRTHQRDFGVAAPSIARVLSEKPNCRLVLFRVPATGQPLLDVEEFPCLKPVTDQIEWRDMVPLQDLPNEIARFDINLAPLETGNIFCEAKSELKYFEAALVDVCTIASPTGPMARTILHSETGMLAGSSEEWYAALSTLVDQPEMRGRLARAAFLDVLNRFGPDRQQDCLSSVLQELWDGPRGALALQARLLRANNRRTEMPEIPVSDVLFSSDALRVSEVTVVIPLYNYAGYIVEALESVRQQTLFDLDLIVVDDASTDDSTKLAVGWMHEHAKRFNRALVVQNRVNAGLALTRNAGFNAAETAFVLPLDADNKLRPKCCEVCLDVLRNSSAGFAYPTIQTFGTSSELIGTHEFLPSRFVAGNYVDAMALVGKWAWLRVGGYAHINYGWEDYDFWCRCVEHGIGGVHVREILADYRVHRASMLHRQTDVRENKEMVAADLEHRHPWLRIARPPV